MLEDNKAIWHKRCRNKFDCQKVSRAKKNYSEECRVSSPVKTRRVSLPVEVQNVNMVTESGDNFAKSCYFLCGEYGASDSGSGFYRVATLEVDRKVRECAQITGDTELLRRMVNCDLIALDSHYHLLCLAKLYKKANHMKKEETGEVERKLSTKSTSPFRID